MPVNGTPPRICMVGSTMVDMISRTPRLPRPGETVVGTSFQTGFGGKGANQAVMAARLGAEVSVVVKLGADSFGRETLANFQANHINVAGVKFDPQLPSGVAPIWVDENTGQNSIIVIPGANLSLTPEEVRAESTAILAADVVLGQLEVPLPATMEAFRIARSSGRTRTLLNPAPAAPLPDELLKLTDILVPNETEAHAITGQEVATLEGTRAAARLMLERGPDTVIITLGDRGALTLGRHHEPVVIPTERVQAVDTTGAGDAFVGALAFLLASRLELGPAIQTACRIATRTVLKHGTQASFPTPEEVRELLQ